MKATLCVLVSLLCIRSVSGARGVRIASASDFSTFVNNVNRGSSYSGSTVLLDSDLSLPEIAEPIGKDANKYFQGTFDGQGYTISDLTLNISSSEYAGLFGYSKGLTIKNVVLGSSCTVENSYTKQIKFYVGGILGLCSAGDGKACNIESNVNMATVAFSGNYSAVYSYSLLGGLVGCIKTFNQESFVKNCANYGTLTHTGESGNIGIGGIIGYTEGSSSSSKVYVLNCLNYGTIIYNGTSLLHMYIGGISGFNDKHTDIEYCLSGGTVLYANSTRHVGGIVGYIYSDTYINHCYFTDKMPYGIHGYAYTTPNVTNTPASPTNASVAVHSLNEQTPLNKWVLNLNSASVSFVIDKKARFSVNYRIILLPDPSDSSDLSFSGWYSDTDLTSPFTSNEVESSTTLYGIFCRSNYTVTFNVNGGDPSSLSVVSAVAECWGVYGELPSGVTREGYSFIGWFTTRDGGNRVVEGDRVTNLNDHTLYAHWREVTKCTLTFDYGNGTALEYFVEPNATIDYPRDPEREGYTFQGWDPSPALMPASDLTVVAQWTPNVYTVRFDVAGGTELPVAHVVVTFNSTYGVLPAPTKEGHSFIGWFTGNNEPVTSETVVRIAGNHTLYAQWVANKYTVTFILYNDKVFTDKRFFFNETIVYPANATRKGYTFNGWDPTPELMPAKNITITAQWSENKEHPSSKTSGNTPLVAGVTTSVFIVVILIIIALFILVKRKRNGDIDRVTDLKDPLMSKGVPVFDDDEHTNIITPSLYPQGYARPTLMEALLAAGLSERKAEVVCSACEECAARRAGDEGSHPEGFTSEDAAAIAMYTYDTDIDDPEHNPYKVINRSLAEGSHTDMQKVSGLLYLLMTALRKLPRSTGETLYRGTCFYNRNYRTGDVITWNELSLVSRDMESTKMALAKELKSGGKVAGTLFIIEGGWGYDIQPYSLFSNEAGILLEPERQFRVVSVITDDGLVLVNLQMLDTPVSLPEVFGGDKW